jgi:hypothetical protein
MTVSLFNELGHSNKLAGNASQFSSFYARIHRIAGIKLDALNSAVIYAVHIGTRVVCLKP